MKKLKKSQTLRAYLYSAPSLVLIGTIVLFPIIYTFYISLTDMSTYHWFDFDVIGFKHYGEAFSVLNGGFLTALLRTILWTVVNMATQLVIAYFIAVLLNRGKLKLKNVYKTILMFPWALPGYVSILLWKTGMFNTEFGLLNKWMTGLGLQAVEWLSTNISAFICCSVVNLWLALPFMIMIMDGALQSIDKSYYEYATLEGANAFKKSWHITLPMIRPIIGPAVIITVFTTFKQFDIIYLLTMQQGTGSDIQTVITYAYENAFITNNYGYSSAISIIIFVMLTVFTMLFNRDMRATKKEGK